MYVLGPCKVRNETETKHIETKQNTTKRNKICKERNETKRDHTMNPKNLENHSSTSTSA